LDNFVGSSMDLRIGFSVFLIPVVWKALL